MCKRLVLVTTSCDEGREKRMVSGSWKPLIDKGATFFRLDNTVASALELAIALLAKDQSVSQAECLELRRRHAKWHTGTAYLLACLSSSIYKTFIHRIVQARRSPSEIHIIPPKRHH